MITDRETERRHKFAAWELEKSTGENQAGEIRVVTGSDREARLGQKPATLLLTGISGSGKSTIARGVERALFDLGRTSIVVDGEELRRGLSRDLGFTMSDRSENLRRGAHLARLLNDNGMICILAMVAPSQEARDKVADLIGLNQFVLVHLDAPLDICRRRDPRGHYLMSNATSELPIIEHTFESPQTSDLKLRTDEIPVDQCITQILDLLVARKLIRR